MPRVVARQLTCTDTFEGTLLSNSNSEIKMQRSLETIFAELLFC